MRKKTAQNEVSLQDLSDACQTEAISTKLMPTTVSTWRMICRNYSKTFNTPLHEVHSMDPEFVLLNYYESQYEPLDLEEHFEILMDMLYTIEDPNYENDKKANLEDFIVEAEEHERMRLIEKRPIHKALAEKNSIFKDEDEPEEVSIPEPKLRESGFLDLSYLEREDSEGSGFED